MKGRHATLAVGAVCLWLLLACASTKPACSPGDLAAIEAAYSARMLAAGCVGVALNTCEAGPSLKAERAAEEKTGGCRK